MDININKNMCCMHDCVNLSNSDIETSNKFYIHPTQILASYTNVDTGTKFFWHCLKVVKILRYSFFPLKLKVIEFYIFGKSNLKSRPKYYKKDYFQKAISFFISQLFSVFTYVCVSFWSSFIYLCSLIA